jgi:hypothetical protein
MLSAPIIASTPSSDFRSALRHFTGCAYRLRRYRQHQGGKPWSRSFRCRDGSLLFRAGLCDRSAPTTPTGLWCCTSKVYTPFMAFTLGVWARHPHVPRSREGSSRRGYRIPLVRTDHLLAAPKATLSWRFDSQVSPSAGHQLRGRLAATPTGLPPASPAQLSGHTPPTRSADEALETLTQPCGRAARPRMPEAASNPATVVVRQRRVTIRRNRRPAGR